VIRRRIRTLLPAVAVAFAVPAFAQPQDQPEDPGARYARIVAETESLERFNRQLDEQVRSQEEEIASIGRQLVEIDTTNREVQPLMQDMVDTLARFIELDLPFLREECKTFRPS
jgi:septal ring factor EnvC (AmiA/AmiB activator)